MKTCYDRTSAKFKYPINSWVILKNETKHKLDPNYLGLFKILYHGPFYTNKIKSAKGETMKVLVNHNRLQQANIENEEQLKAWTKNQGRKLEPEKFVPKGNYVVSNNE
ncbi:hypothetical protein AYI69_g7176 [Smittium culicis]|uniref:Uncharacterized protein n=1 Tax=Smittium culicis TaxID=133412 RepID=A0A1R1XE15_9FUNG|nr:hypothetical protein AYI69_g9236 [Smittium culicis]OMJ18076.1 hypothetical protein AYI69_g7176 [Smittium culicis]